MTEVNSGRLVMCVLLTCEVQHIQNQGNKTDADTKMGPSMWQVR